MSYEITDTIEGKDVDFKNPSPKFYKAVGEEKGMRELMHNFYEIIYKSDISNFFPQDKDAFDEIALKNTNFFVQLCGGPKIYEEETGGMDLDTYMIRIHDDFTIAEKARIEWLGCMREALEGYEMDEELKADFWDYCDKFSKLTVNSFPEKREFNPYH